MSCHEVLPYYSKDSDVYHKCKNCTIGDNARIEGSILMDGVTVDRNAVLRGAIVDSDVRIEHGVTFDGGGQTSVVEAGVVLSGGNRLFM